MSYLFSQGMAVTAFSSFGAPSYMELDMASAQESCLQVLPPLPLPLLSLASLSSSSLSPFPISLHHRMRCTLTSRSLCMRALSLLFLSHCIDALQNALHAHLLVVHGGRGMYLPITSPTN